MKKRLVVGSAFAMLLLAGVAFGGRLLNSPMERGFSDNNGHFWHVRTSFIGKGLIASPDGHKVGQFENAPFLPSVFNPVPGADPASARLVVDTAGRHYVISGLGQHTLRDKNGNSLGTITLTAFDAADVRTLRIKSELDRMPKNFLQAAGWAKRQEQTGGGTSGASGNVYSAYGFDSSSQFYFFVRGIVSVRMSATDGCGVTSDASIMSSHDQRRILGYTFDPGDFTVPQIAISNGETSFTEAGYGERMFISEDRKTRIRLDIEPLGHLKRSFLVMVGDSVSRMPRRP